MGVYGCVYFHRMTFCLTLVDWGVPGIIKIVMKVGTCSFMLVPLGNGEVIVGMTQSIDYQEYVCTFHSCGSCDSSQRSTTYVCSVSVVRDVFMHNGSILQAVSPPSLPNQPV